MSLVKSSALWPGLLAAAWLSGCVIHPQPADILNDLNENSEFQEPVCPKIVTNDGKYRLLKNAQVYMGPSWDAGEIIPVTSENNKAKVSLWIPEADWYSYLQVKCHYYGLADIIEIPLPNITRYCVAVLVKEQPPGVPPNFVFWCIPSQIYDQSGVENFPSPYAPKSDGDS